VWIDKPVQWLVIFSISSWYKGLFIGTCSSLIWCALSLSSYGCLQFLSYGCLQFLCIGKTVKICSSPLSESGFPKLLYFTNICNFCILATALDSAYVQMFATRTLAQFRRSTGKTQIGATFLWTESPGALKGI